MKKVYLLLTLLGLVLNLTTMMPQSLEGNILLWGKPEITTELAFANEISSIFMYDLFFAVLVFSIWLLVDGKKLGVKRPWLTIIWTMIFGLAVSFPYYLYQREIAKNKDVTE